MICLDANVFLRALVPPVNDRTRQEHEQAVTLFEAANHNRVTLTASDVVIHEALYMLTLKPARNGYGLTPAEACERMRALIVLPSFVHPRKPILLDAMALWHSHPELGFSDALTASLARHDHLQLLTFDAHFDDLDDLDRYEPAA